MNEAELHILTIIARRLPLKWDHEKGLGMLDLKAAKKIYRSLGESGVRFVVNEQIVELPKSDWTNLDE